MSTSSKKELVAVSSRQFVKENKTDKIWWAVTYEIGVWEFSFDKKKIYNMFRDYPYNMTEEEVAIFDKENPFWAEFFEERKKNKPGV